MGSLTSSDLIFPTDAFAWLGFTTHVYNLLEDSVRTRVMWAGPWRGVGVGGGRASLRAEGGSSESTWLPPANPTCPRDPTPPHASEADALTGFTSPTPRNASRVPGT